MSENTVLGIGSRVKHPSFGEGAIIRLHKAAYDVCFMKFGIKQVGKQYDNWEIIECIEADQGVSFSEAEKALVKILKAYSAVQEEVQLGHRWNDGVIIFKSANPDLKPKEIPIDTFFHKIVMVRDRLRVMEQRINSSKLSDEEKVNLQQYITRIYGSLTTFNVLFQYKEDQFSGEKTR